VRGDDHRRDVEALLASPHSRYLKLRFDKIYGHGAATTAIKAEGEKPHHGKKRRVAKAAKKKRKGPRGEVVITRPQGKPPHLRRHKAQPGGVDSEFPARGSSDPLETAEEEGNRERSLEEAIYSTYVHIW